MKYEEPKMEVLKLEKESTIRTSGGGLTPGRPGDGGIGGDIFRMPEE